MPPRHAYWTILIGDSPTAFRARERDELLPTFERLRAKQPDAVLKWFERGRLWASPEEARGPAPSPSGPQDRRGKEFRVKGQDLFARALQHEIDHLNGVLYIDYLDSLEELVRVSEHAEIEEETTAGI